jgi:hypothetical protein
MPDAHDDVLREVTVTYAAAPQPYRQQNVPKAETVGVLKKQAMNAFHVVEQPTVTFTLYDGKRALADENETLGHVAGHQEALHLKLVQEIKQG